MLGVETATRIASVGVVADGQVRAERRQPLAGSHARTLLPLLDAVLGDAGLRLAGVDRLAVSIGPGSFTGLRIGLSIAKGLALATGLPLVAVPTLEAYACAAGPCDGSVWPVLDARKGEVYAAGFVWRDGHPQAIAPAAALTPAALAARLTSICTLVGDGVDAHAAAWAALPGAVRRLPLDACPPSGAWVARLGAAAAPAPLAEVQPLYCRAAEAEVVRDRRQAALSVG